MSPNHFSCGVSAVIHVQARCLGFENIDACACRVLFDPRAGHPKSPISALTILRNSPRSTLTAFSHRQPPSTFSGMLAPEFGPRSSLFLLDKKWGFVTAPRGIFNRCTVVYLARGIPMRIVATAIRTKSLLARFALNATSACLAAKRLKSIGNGAASSTFAFGFGRLA